MSEPVTGPSVGPWRGPEGGPWFRHGEDALDVPAAQVWWVGARAGWWAGGPAGPAAAESLDGYARSLEAAQGAADRALRRLGWTIPEDLGRAPSG